MLSAVTDAISVCLYCLFCVIDPLLGSTANTGGSYTAVYNALGLDSVFGMSFIDFSNTFYGGVSFRENIAFLRDYNSFYKYILPLFAVGIAISVILLAVKIIKAFIWLR